jgi:hypothetical protein
MEDAMQAIGSDPGSPEVGDSLNPDSLSPEA